MIIIFFYYLSYPNNVKLKKIKAVGARYMKIICFTKTYFKFFGCNLARNSNCSQHSPLTLPHEIEKSTYGYLHLALKVSANIKTFSS